MKDDTAILVKGVQKQFKVPHEKHNTLKEKAVHAFSAKKYSKYKALKNIDFEIKKGDFFGIVGRNGCGKSTLLKIIANIYQPTKGEVQVNGKIAPFIELGVGFNPELTGRENVFLSGTILGLTKKRIEELYDEIVAFAELSEFMDQKLKNYSSGMQVRLAFSIAVRAEADILLIDEVLAVGDAAFQAKCFDYFNKLRSNGSTVCFVTHDMSAVNRFCTKALIIEDGRIKKMGKPSEIADIYTNDNLVKDNAKENSKGEISLSIRELEKENKIEIKIILPKIEKIESFIGLTILKDGNVIAEINNLNQNTIKKSSKVFYILDKKDFNPGVYEISASLIEKTTKTPISHTHNRATFVVGGNDITRGGGMKLTQSWR
jgi:ABC-2 type transport system ATP-binding protein